MTVNNDNDDDSATKHSDCHTLPLSFAGAPVSILSFLASNFRALNL